MAMPADMHPRLMRHTDEKHMPQRLPEHPIDPKDMVQHLRRHLGVSVAQGEQRTSSPIFATGFEEGLQDLVENYQGHVELLFVEYLWTARPSVHSANGVPGNHYLP